MFRGLPGFRVVQLDVDVGEKLRKEEVKMQIEVGGVASFPLFCAKTKGTVIRQETHHGT